MDEPPIREQLRPFVGSRKKVRVARSIPSEPHHNGFVLGLDRDWVLLQQFHDFYPEGYVALRVADVITVRSGEYERQWERMFAGEGILNRVGIRYSVSLHDVQSLLKSLQQRGNNVIVECEDFREALTDFYIGRILLVEGGSLFFANFDALGKWDDRPRKIALDEITQVQFDTPYVNTFSKYLEGPCPHVGRAP